MIRTTHICLLSEQPTPNICPLLDGQLRANDVVFVVTPGQRERLEWLREVLKQHQVRIGELPIDDPYTDNATIQLRIEKEIHSRRSAGDRVLVNVTGGTKPMSIAAHMAAFNCDVPAFYVHADRVSWLYMPKQEIETYTPIDLEDRIKLPAFLLSHGIRLTGAGPPETSDSHNALIDDLLRRDPAAYARGIRALNYHASQAQGTLRATLGKSDYENGDLQAVIDLFERHGLLTAERHALQFPDQEARFFCAGGWLEDHVYQVVRDLAGELKPRLNDYRRSVEVEHLGARRESPRNELDVAVLYNNTLHIIECKTRRYTNAIPRSSNDELTEPLYKLNALKRKLGGLRARAMLVSYQSVQSFHRERASQLDIEIVAARELTDLHARIRQWLQTTTGEFSPTSRIRPT